MIKFSITLHKLDPKIDKQHSRRTPVEFHVSRKSRDKYQFEETLFAATGNVIFADFHAARVFAQKMNEKRDLVEHPELAVKAGHINAMGLIDEILHYIASLYREQINAGVFQSALEWLHKEFGEKDVNKALVRFVEDFPPVGVYKDDLDAKTYLQGETSGVSNRAIALEEMLMLWLANMNPAFSPYLELFDDTALEHETAYLGVMRSLRNFFETQPRFGPDNLNLIDMLRQPAIESPDSLESQLQLMRERWGLLIQRFLLRILGGLDFIKEELKGGFWGPGPTEVLKFDWAEYEAERFSPDVHWMPNLVLLAKSTLVWMDQLSKKYQRAIHRLDQIPDEELDTLARWGFTGLWLIGIWQRSNASRRIKQMCGNPEAESSAYSLFDYEIAHEIGGYPALQNLKDRCWQRGIRLACDMVPNHTGVDSKWVREHPEWYISLTYSPYPSYTFHGTNLSEDPRYGIFIEDNYYNRTDAAVVFKREDYWNGDVKYIYHGNDGTSMPWNDTAQLNYLNSEVREAVIQKILHVARMFPVIRFDAAMTLAKKHYQRLWFPEPGSGGDIPSRAQFGLTKDEFNRQIPNEFWREVVDRVAQEVPETLLLAEAFWMMEGYFVRTLGMHRVYNSAFMNMLKNEENEKYRSTIKNTIQFNPEILKRYVNFMNNPDEETAVAQFGKGDKYFGVCTMMVTMPGLPMFGHGQIEGFSEKYGMEYRRAYWEEPVDWYLVHRHEREIFPLMKKRYLFAEVENFLLYDLFTAEGYVNENVFAYSNRRGNEKGLVVFNNKFDHAAGWIRMSAAFAQKTGLGDEVRQVQKSLGDGLALSYDDNAFCIFRDQSADLEFIRSSKDVFDRGLHVELGAYKYQVFVEFREVQDDATRKYSQLNEYLNGRGVPSIEEEFKELTLRSLLQPYDALLNKPKLEEFMASRVIDGKQIPKKEVLADFRNKYQEAFTQAKKHSLGLGKPETLSRNLSRKLENVLYLPVMHKRIPQQKSGKIRNAIEYLKEPLNEDWVLWSTVYGWLTLHEVGRVFTEVGYEELSRIWLHEWLLSKRVNKLLIESGANPEQAWEGVQLLNILTSQQNWFQDMGSKKERERRILNALLRMPEVQQFLKMNRFEGVLWFNQENFHKLLWWLFLIAVIQKISLPKKDQQKITREIEEIYSIIEAWRNAEQVSEYKVEKLLDAVKDGVHAAQKQKSKKKTASAKKIPKGKKNKKV